MSAEEFRSEMPATASRPETQGQTTTGRRVYTDCRETPSVNNCSLFISGTETEVVAAARQHMVSAHGHTDGPELETMIRGTLHEIPAEEKLA